MRRLVQGGGLFLVYLLLAMLLCWPAPLQLSRAFLGHPDVDVWNHVWGFWWFDYLLLERFRLPLFTALLSHPFGGRLYFIDPLNALLSLPLQALFGLPAAYNLILFLELAFSGFATHLLARELHIRRSAAFLAGISLLLTPYLRCELHNGISEVLNLGWLSLGLLMAARALRLPSRSRAIQAGACLGLTVVACWYYGLAALMAVGLLALFTHWHGRETWRRARLYLREWLAGGLALLAVAGPFVLAFGWTLGGESPLIRRPATLSDFLVQHNATDFLSFFVPGDYHHPDLWAEYGERFLHTTYLGWGLLLLSLLAIRQTRARAWLFLSLTFAVLALGPYLYLGGDFVRIFGWRLPLPAFILSKGLGLMAITHPGRFVAITLIGLSLLAAMGLESLLDRFPRLANILPLVIPPAVALEALIFAPGPFPVPLADATFGPCATWLATQPTHGAVLDLPSQHLGTMRTSRYLYAQTLHRRPVPYSVDVRADTAVGLQQSKVFTAFRRLNAGLNSLELATQNLPKEVLLEDFYRSIVQRNFRYVVLHRDIQSAPLGLWPYRRLLDSILSPPLSTPDGCWIYPLEGPRRQR